MTLDIQMEQSATPQQNDGLDLQMQQPTAPVPNPDTTAAVAQHFQANIDATKAANTDAQGNVKPMGFMDTLNAAFQIGKSTSIFNEADDLKKGLPLPDGLPETSPLLQKGAAMAGQISEDMPFYLAGGLAGVAAPGSPFVKSVAAGAGAFAFPAALRSVIWDKYKNGEFTTNKDAAWRLAQIAIDTAKGAVTGATTVVGGEVVGGAAAMAGAGAGLTELAGTSGAALTQPTVAAALEKHLPSPSDFALSALFFGGAHGAGVPFNKLGDIWTKTGVRPEQVKADAINDPGIHRDFQSDLPVPRAYDPPVANDPKPPQPFTADEAKAPPVPDEATLASRTPGQAALDDIKAHVVNELPIEKGAPYTADQLKTDFFNKLNPVKLYQEKFNDGKKLAPDDQNPYNMLASFAGVSNKSAVAIEKFTTNALTGAKNGEGLETITKPFGKDLGNLEAYWVAKSAVERADTRGQTKFPFDIQRARDAVNDPENIAKYDDAAQRLTAWGNRRVDYVRDSQMINNKSATAIKELNKNHAPLNRLLPDPTDVGLPASMQGKGKSPFKNMSEEGSDKDILHPLNTTIKQQFQMQSLADHNRAKLAFFDAHDAWVEKDPENNKGFDIVNPKLKATTVGEDEMQKYLKANGIDKMPDDLLTVFRAFRQPLEPGQVSVFRNGKPVVYDVGDERLANALNGTVSEGMNNAVAKVAAAMTRPTRNLLTASPPFWAYHITRQNQRLLINQPDTGFSPHALPFYTVLSGFARTYLGGEHLVDDYLAAGGGTAQWGLLQQDDFAGKILKDVGADVHGATFGSAAKQIGEGIQGLHGLNDVMPGSNMSYAEALQHAKYYAGDPSRGLYNVVQGSKDLATLAMNKLGTAYDAALHAAHFPVQGHDTMLRATVYANVLERNLAGGMEEGQARENAVAVARQVLLDNSQLGAKMQAVNSIWLFSGLKVNGFGKLAENFRDNPMRMAMRLSYTTVMPTLLLWAAQHNNPMITQISDKIKALNFLVALDNWRKPKPGEDPINVPGMSRPAAGGGTEYNYGHVLKIAKTQEEGVIFGSAVNALLDFAQQRDPKTAEKVLSALGDIITPDEIPSLLNGPYEQATNRNSMSGAPLVTEAACGRLPSTQYNSYTTDAAKKLGAIIGTLPGVGGPCTNGIPSIASPAVVETYVRALSGSAGMEMLQLADYLAAASGHKPDPTRHAAKVEDNVFGAAFLARGINQSSQPITNFRDSMKEAHTNFNQIKFLLKTQPNNPEIQDLKPLLQAEPVLTGYENAMKRGEAAISAISADRKSTADEKAQKIDKLTYEIYNIAVAGNKALSMLAARASKGPQQQIREQKQAQ